MTRRRGSKPRLRGAAPRISTEVQRCPTRYSKGETQAGPIRSGGDVRRPHRPALRRRRVSQAAMKSATRALADRLRPSSGSRPSPTNQKAEKQHRQSAVARRGSQPVEGVTHEGDAERLDTTVASSNFLTNAAVPHCRHRRADAVRQRRTAGADDRTRSSPRYGDGERPVRPVEPWRARSEVPFEEGPLCCTRCRDRGGTPQAGRRSRKHGSAGRLLCKSKRLG